MQLIQQQQAKSQKQSRSLFFKNTIPSSLRPDGIFLCYLHWFFVPASLGRTLVRHTYMELLRGDDLNITGVITPLNHLYHRPIIRQIQLFLFSTILVHTLLHQNNLCMKKIFLAAAPMLFLVACSSSQSSNTPGPPSPVETKTANSPQYKPAFEGQTRIAGIKTTTTFTTKTITKDLVKPWSMAALPDGRFLVTQKEGTFRIVSANGTVSNNISGAPTVDAAGQGGLLGVTIDPDFATNRLIYFVFSEPVAGGNHAAVAKARLKDDETAIENVAVIYRVTPTYKGHLHNGGKLAFTKDGKLFFATGERSDIETRPLAQDNTTTLGKILLITKTGQAVTDPLMLPKPNTKPEIFSSGHRNPLGIAIHPTTGELWEAEMGPRGGDEINIIRRGVNYGWPIITYGIEYSGATIGEGITQKAGYEQPVYYWDPAISPGGITFYTGNNISEWNNNLFVASLSGKHIIRLQLNGNKIAGEERLLEKEGQRFRDVGMGKDGNLYAITDEGRMYCLSKE